MLTGLNHLTLAVTDLQRSVDFYVRVLGFRPRAQWDMGAYLELGDLWLCLSSDEQRSQARSSDYTHYAFTIAQRDFAHFVEHARSCGVRNGRATAAKAIPSTFWTRMATSSKPMSVRWKAAWRNAACGLMQACGFSTESAARQRRQERVQEPV
jgi:hypothetical protein